MIILLDSDILIEASRGRNPEITTTFRSLVAGSNTIFYSPVSASELWEGARPSEFEATTQLFQTLTCLTIDCSVGELAGNFLRRFAKSHSLEVPDALIAASAFHKQAQLWTRNRKHYPMPELSFYEA